MRRVRKRWLIWLGKMMAPAGCALAGIMLITAITMSSAHGATLATGMSAAVQDVIQPTAQFDSAGCAVTGTAIAAKEFDIATAVARQEGIQQGAEQSVPIATAADAPDLAGKEASATAAIERSIRYAALTPTPQFFALVVT